MFFTVTPSQIQQLGELQLVQLLRRLMYSEASSTGIPLRGVSVPLQITVADGGEDASCQWLAGRDSTDYFPARLTIFQSKATNTGPSEWKKEMWTQDTRRDGVARVLNPAVERAIAARGAYVGFCSWPLVGNKLATRVAKMKEGIREAGADPDQLGSLEIYDANRIAGWASAHPAVAVWINQEQSGLDLAGFHTLEFWGKTADFSTIQQVEDAAQRFSIADDSEQVADGRRFTANQAKERILAHIAAAGACVRVRGSSGLGKSRFVYQLFSGANELEKHAAMVSTIYCDFRSVEQGRLQQLCEEVVKSAAPTLLVVDECPREVAVALAEVARSDGSELRIVSIGIDDRPIDLANVLNVEVGPGDRNLIEGIVKQRAPNVDAATVGYLSDLASGYPRIAVIATDSHLGNLPLLKSIEDVVERVLAGCQVKTQDQVRAIECLSLFERVGFDAEAAHELDLIAVALTRQSPDEMFEHLAAASLHELVDRRGKFFRAVPLPIAIHLGSRRLNLLRASTLMKFIEQAPEALLSAMFDRWRRFDGVRTASELAEQLIGPNGMYGTLDPLKTQVGARHFDALAHIVPDTAARTLDRVLGKIPLEELAELGEGRRSIVWALEKLVFRRQTFAIAARQLMRLAAMETETYANNASGQFQHLFFLHLSGTEVEPAERFAILDEGLASTDSRIVSVCVEALSKSLERMYFTRTGGSEQIGSAAPLADWAPSTWQEYFDFYRAGLSRLERLITTNSALAPVCERIISGRLRGLLCEQLFQDLERIIDVVTQQNGTWFDALTAISEWLYFDRPRHPEDFQTQVRGLYDRLLPSDPVTLAIVYTRSWPTELYDPDQTHNGENGGNDFEYAARKAAGIARVVAADRELTKRAIREMANGDLKSVRPFARELMTSTADPIGVFRATVDAIEASEDPARLAFLQGLLSGADARDPALADQCVALALKAEKLKESEFAIRSAVRLSVVRLAEIVKSIRAGEVAPSEAISLSYGQGLAHLKAQDIVVLLDELAENHATEGLWAAIEIILMYRHGRDEFEPLLLARVKQYLAAPALLGETNHVQRSYLIEAAVQSLAKREAIDDMLATALAEQVIRTCQDAGWLGAHRGFADASRQIVGVLVKEQPDALWRSISSFVERATPGERRRLQRIVGSAGEAFTADADLQKSAGPLFGVHEPSCIKWADGDPPSRAPFLCEFFPVFSRDDGGHVHWHPSMTAIAERYGQYESFLAALDGRVHVSAWSGSLVPYLEFYFEPLQEWIDRKSGPLADWARNKRYELERQIVAEQRSDDEWDLA
jgi:hypothetical protein